MPRKKTTNSLVVGGLDYGQDGCLCLFVSNDMYPPVLGEGLPTGPLASLQFYDLPWDLEDKDNKTDRWDAAGWSDLLDEALPQCDNTLILVERFFARFATTGHISSAIHWGMMTGELRRRGINYQVIGAPEWKPSVGATKDKGKSVRLARRLWGERLLPSTRRLRHDEAEASLLTYLAMQQLDRQLRARS